MRDVAEYINEVKRDNETLQIMNDIQVRAQTRGEGVRVVESGL